MSPVVQGNANAAVHDHRHVPFARPRPAVDDDPWERLELARARKTIQSPIKAPEGGWSGPEPLSPAESATTTKASPKSTKAKRAKKSRATKSSSPKTRPEDGNLDSAEVANELREQWEHFKALAARGDTAPQIAEALGWTARRVRADARAAGISLPRAGGPGPGRTPHWNVDDAIQLAKQGLTAREISEQVGASAVTVRRTLARHGTPLVDGRTKFSGTSNPVSQRLADLDHEHVLALYADLGNAHAVAAALGAGASTITRVLHQHGVDVRSSGEVQKGRPSTDRARWMKDEMRAAGVTSAVVREWALEQGHAVADRGIPSKAVWLAYKDAHLPTTHQEN
ncbi:Lsr2 family DNA-binding protein [Janibacter sp. GS2]|uniref:Lsr2 family DNA-binding protein n=1 Tax=Janibacter sp. GS2 TaxID=3442646 RepID=UPI003EBF09F7